ncbi:hypothetical protein F2Q68_00038025 [Brassica cretica]|uniref:Uncharacterized protein n=1 Tax=Brassica cretica TaxID=69181 RepID=A0A8S9H8R8_BRACR|nr:hypothetical protein F2Q68_00038025 [Brassica cretica]
MDESLQLQFYRSSTLLLKQLSSPMTMVVIVSFPSSLHPLLPPLRFRPPPDPPPRLPSPMSFEVLFPPLWSYFLVLSEALFPSEPLDLPPCSPYRCRSELSSRRNHQILPMLHAVSLFFCTLTHHSLWFVSTLQSQLFVVFLSPSCDFPQYAVSPWYLIWLLVLELDAQASLVWLMLFSAYVAVFVTSQVTRFDVSSFGGVKLC